MASALRPQPERKNVQTRTDSPDCCCCSCYLMLLPMFLTACSRTARTTLPVRPAVARSTSMMLNFPGQHVGGWTASRRDVDGSSLPAM
ncbi:conserved hypothetical protein [Culex quinquefasciatus]|uniref:Uncharacterized protein n=1 Tax=Culex quinquefasciatus TaxID=7176 RepID=B0WDT7_CULQU|nr:conserved hypothetical protein [Culex quinquefasciatus]|eukprot:XP_001846871.1 conserved hypothetical protein [Culex quinquefasciatus]